MHFSAVAPPRGERGSKYLSPCPGLPAYCRSPSWGAWIEIWTFWKGAAADPWSLPLVGSVDRNAPELDEGDRIVESLPLVGSVDRNRYKEGETYHTDGRSPSWGAWIEIRLSYGHICWRASRSPSWGAWIEIMLYLRVRCCKGSLPLVGSVDRNPRSEVRAATADGRSPSWGAWIEIR